MFWSNFFLSFHSGSCCLRIEYCYAFIAYIRDEENWRKAIGTECQGCGRMFGTLSAYVQHRRSRVVRGTACCALPDENRFNVSAAPRPNMFTAALERRPAKRTRGGGQSKQFLHFLLIMHIGHIATISKRAYSRAVGRGLGPFWDCIF